MPALPNPRLERYAQLFFAGLSEGITQAEAYKAAGFLPSNSNSAHAAASRAMTGRNRRLSVVNRVKELMEESNKRLAPKLDISRRRVGERLDKASRLAEQQGNAQGMVSSELGLAKVFGLEHEQESRPQELMPNDSTRDIGRKLLQSMGLREPDDVSIQAAVEANDLFVSALEDICLKAQATIDVG
jgi:hypothetical protein